MQAAFVFQLVFHYAVNIVIIYIVFYCMVPFYIRLDLSQQLIVASATPLIGSIGKAISRISLQNMENFTHPGNLYIISLPAYIISAITYRTLQADIESNLYFALICMFHSFVGFMGKLSILLRDHLLMWFYKRVLKKEIVNGRIGSFRTPRTQRYTSDLILCHMMHEVIVLLYCNVFRQLYQLQFSFRNKVLYNLILRCAIGIFSEYLFGSLSVFVLTWYLNIPIVKLWKRQWKTYAKTNLIIGMIIIGYITHHLIYIIDASYTGTALMERRSCNVSQLLFFKHLESLYI